MQHFYLVVIWKSEGIVRENQKLLKRFNPAGSLIQSLCNVGSAPCVNGGGSIVQPPSRRVEFEWNKTGG